MIFNKKYFLQASCMSLIMGFGMNLHASGMSQNEKNIEKVIAQAFKPLIDEHGVVGMAIGVIYLDRA